MNSKIVMVENIGQATLTKNRKAIRFKISVRPTGTVSVTIPRMASFHDGEKFLLEHLQWIIKTKEKLAAKHVERQLIRPGHLFSTRNYRYEIILGEVQGLKIRYGGNDKKIYFEIPNNHEIGSDELQSQLKQAIENVLRFDAKRYLPFRTSELAKVHGYTFNNVAIKNNKTNWGSCSNKKNLNLNIHLMRLEDRIIDYVIVHELVHTVIPNHGPCFKATMLKHFPDSIELESALKKIKTGLI